MSQFFFHPKARRNLLRPKVSGGFFGQNEQRGLMGLVDKGHSLRGGVSPPFSWRDTIVRNPASANPSAPSISSVFMNRFKSAGFGNPSCF